VSYSWQITNLERDGLWTPEWDPTINPKQPTGFAVEKTASGLVIVCDGQPDSGALGKCTSQWLNPSASVEFGCTVKFGDDIQYAQVIEMDSKFTDASGFTYDGSFQFNVANGWMTQINNPWVNTGVPIPLEIDIENGVAIRYGFDYVNKNIRFASANGKPIAMPAIPAQNHGWAPNTIVTQLQLCIASVAGAYSVEFSGIGYKSLP
jgi:hypothetical protein